jgi:hypothetical protein
MGFQASILPVGEKHMRLFALALLILSACGPSFALSTLQADVDTSYGPNLVIVRAKADPSVKVSANWQNATVLKSPSDLSPSYVMASNPDTKSGDQIEVLSLDSITFLQVPDPHSGNRVMVESKDSGVVVYAPGAPVSVDVSITGTLDGETRSITTRVTAVN